MSLETLPPTYCLSLHPSVFIGEGSERSPHVLVLAVSSTRLRLTLSGPGARKAFAILAGEGASEEELASLVEEADGAAALATLHYQIRKLADLGWLARTLKVGDRPFSRLTPLKPLPSFLDPQPALGQWLRLNRFAACRPGADGLLVESSRAWVELLDWRAAALFGKLAKRGKLSALSQGIAGLSDEAIVPFLEMLKMAGLVSDEEVGDEGEPSASQQWEWHDRVFHLASRRRTLGPSYGGTFRFLDRIAPQAALKPAMSDEVFELEAPDLAALEKVDRPFSQVLEQRRSWRRYSDEPISRTQLGAFLFRSARMRDRITADTYEATLRPYPGGGACYPLEIYPLVHACRELPQGLFQYLPDKHRLCRLAADARVLEALLRDAVAATGMESPPQVLILISARFQRVSWKYQSMAYAAILKEVGALYQTMYLVATAMGLAPCALGGGNSDLFAAATGLNGIEESSVGEFILGTPA